MAFTYRAQQFIEDGNGNRTTYSFPSLAAGPVAPEKWAVVVVFLDVYTATQVSALSIAGAAATFMGRTTDSGGLKAEYWKRRIDAATTATVDLTADAVTWHSGVLLYTSDTEPTLTDQSFTESTTGTLYSTTVDIPAGGSLIAHVVQQYNGTIPWDWTGVTEDGNALYLGTSMPASWASANNLSATTGATVSVDAPSPWSVGGLLSVGAFSFASGPPPGPIGTDLNYWNGTAWEAKPLMRWNGTAWEPAQLQRWNGTAWVNV